MAIERETRSDKDQKPPSKLRFRPTVAATVTMVVALAILVGLGTWQLQRLAWKTELLDRIEARTTADPVAFPPLDAVDDLVTWDYRPVTLQGEYLHDREMHLVARTMDGRSGVHLVTPLERPDGTHVLVNRGWTPDSARDRGERQQGLQTGAVTVTAIARIPEEQGWMQPDNDPGRNDWYWPDLPRMAEVAGVGDPGGLIFEVVTESGKPDEAFPLGGHTRVDIPNNHLEYALTWYGLALTMIAVFVVFFTRREGEDRT